MRIFTYLRVAYRDGVECHREEIEIQDESQAAFLRSLAGWAWAGHTVNKETGLSYVYLTRDSHLGAGREVPAEVIRKQKAAERSEEERLR